MVSIYALIDPNTNKIRYIGKTIARLSKRFGNHIDNAKSKKHNIHLSNWILKLLADNQKPIIKLIEECSNDIWKEREKYWISYYPELINLTEGGDGCLGLKHNSAAIEKLRLVNKGKKHDENFKINMSKRLKGVSLSEDHKQKIGKANKGKKHSKEFSQMISKRNKGKIKSEDEKEKTSKSIREWWRVKKLNKDIV